MWQRRPLNQAGLPTDLSVSLSSTAQNHRK